MKPSVYTRPRKPLAVAVPRRDWREPVSVAPLPALVTVDAGTECHVTPQDVARRMVDLTPNLRGLDCLEPSAGTGNIAREMVASGAAGLVMVEMHCRLAGLLHGLGHVENRDFLEYAKDCGRQFDAIVMNPPFRNVRAHVAAAESLLRRGGSLVALVPSTFDRAGYETAETLPESTFALAKVRTKIVQLFR